MNRYSPPIVASFNWFLAIRPHPEVADRILDLGRWLRDRHGLRASLRPGGILHISLHGVGGGSSIPQSALHDTIIASEETSLLAPPFEVGFDRIVNFGQPSDTRPLVLTQQKGENAELMIFHRMLGQALRAFGMRAGSSFTPHVTMFYGEEAPEMRVERVSWRVEEFELIRSRIGATHYDSLGRWKLRGEAFPPGAPSLAHSAKRNSGQKEFGLET